jgi:hypothetical protein
LIHETVVELRGEVEQGLAKLYRIASAGLKLAQWQGETIKLMRCMRSDLTERGRG